MNPSLLIELGTEDLPARYVQPLTQALAQGLAGGLAKRGVETGASRSFATPRRIAVLIEGVAERQAEQQLERKGPQLAAAFKDGQPTPAALGFAKSCGVEFKALKQENGYLVFRKKQKGRKTLELIAEIFEETLKQMDQLVPKRMRWGAGEETFVRPVQWILALYGSRIVPLQRFGLKAGRKTYGHRFHAPQAITLKELGDYESALRNAKVWADFTSRRAEIRRQIEAEAVKLRGSARIAEELLDEVTALVEWPVAISGGIEERFLQLPPEVVVATVETNQRYFTLFDTAGKLLPYFITVANIESKDVAQVIAGNERVVRPRLTDALFFWEQDRKQPLEAYGEKLNTVTFQKDLGSTGEKVARIRALANLVADRIASQSSSPRSQEQEADFKRNVDRAAQLAKNDLVTKMVYEFPELQGLMGGYYARAGGEPDAVAQAVAEHYQPTQAGGPIPSTRVGQIVALADKLDSLAGIFAIGQKPTASKDPYALRRAALGALRICVEGNLDLNLHELLQVALKNQPAGKRDDAVLNDLWNFVLERLKSYLTSFKWSTSDGAPFKFTTAEGAELPWSSSSEIFEAVVVLGITSPADFKARFEAVRSFQTTAAAKALAAADKRARNILRQSGGQPPAVKKGLFEVPSERALLAEIERVESTLVSLKARSDYGAMLQALSSLKEPVDAFFDGVMVMADNPEVRGNRLALLARLDALCREVADLSCLPG